jgi:Na+-transporting NADH:ubiquinone oxidoreductase subunit NqrD
VPGLVIGTFLLGCLYSLLWRVAELFGKGTFLGALLYFFVILYPTSAGDASTMFILIPSLLILLLPFIFWAKVKTAARWMFQPPMQPDHAVLLVALKEPAKSPAKL